MAKYRRRIFLIDKPFQFKVALYLCSWLAALTFVYPSVIYNVFDLFVSIASLDPMGPELESLFRARNDIIKMMILGGIGFTLLTFVVGIFFAHRIAGPIYKLRMYLRKLKEGDLSAGLFFRKEDHFKYLADEYNEAIDGLRGRLDRSALHIRMAMNHCPPQARQELEKALALLPPSK